jgi:DNA-binding response OmpR family regulator
MGQEFQSRQILVCEDDPAMMRIFQFLLRQQGFREILTTSKGQTVVPLAEKNLPSLILLDLMLPDGDGLTVLEALKQNEATRSIPVIVVSGKEAQDQVQQAMMAGAIDYVIKPFEPMELGARIKNFLDTIVTSADESAPPSSPVHPNMEGRL